MQDFDQHVAKEGTCTGGGQYMQDFEQLVAREGTCTCTGGGYYKVRILTYATLSYLVNPLPGPLTRTKALCVLITRDS